MSGLKQFMLVLLRRSQGFRAHSLFSGADSTLVRHQSPVLRKFVVPLAVIIPPFCMAHDRLEKSSAARGNVYQQPCRIDIVFRALHTGRVSSHRLS